MASMNNTEKNQFLLGMLGKLQKSQSATCPASMASVQQFVSTYPNPWQAAKQTSTLYGLCGFPLCEAAFCNLLGVNKKRALAIRFIYASQFPFMFV